MHDPESSYMHDPESSYIHDKQNPVTSIYYLHSMSQEHAHACVHAHTRVHTHTRARMRAHTRRHSHMYACVCMHLLVCVCVSALTKAYSQHTAKNVFLRKGIYNHAFLHIRYFYLMNFLMKYMCTCKAHAQPSWRSSVMGMARNAILHL